MRRIYLLCFILLAFAGCQPGNEGEDKQEYCTYIAGGDCDCYKPAIKSTDVLCVPCDPGQTSCPNIVRMKIVCPEKGGKRDTCDITATRQNTSCTTCPSGGKKLKKGDASVVVIGEFHTPE